MSTHEFDSGRHFWLAATVLAALTGALLAPGCDARNFSAGEASEPARPASKRDFRAGEQIVESPSLQPIRIDGGFQRRA